MRDIYNRIGLNFYFYKDDNWRIETIYYYLSLELGLLFLINKDCGAIFVEQIQFDKDILIYLDEIDLINEQTDIIYSRNLSPRNLEKKYPIKSNPKLEKELGENLDKKFSVIMAAIEKENFMNRKTNNIDKYWHCLEYGKM